MAYVDLNPIRAGMAESPETSEFTSIQERIRPTFDIKQAVKRQAQCGNLLEYNTNLKPLLHFDGAINQKRQSGILYGWQDYLELVDWSGRIIRDDKLGSIDSQLPPILERLQISHDQWRINTTQFEAIHARRFNRATPTIDTG